MSAKKYRLSKCYVTSKKYRHVDLVGLAFEYHISKVVERLRLVVAARKVLSADLVFWNKYLALLLQLATATFNRHE